MSDSTAPATIAEPPPGSSASGRGCWPPPTPTTRSPTIAPTGKRWVPGRLDPNAPELVRRGKLEKRTVDAVLEAAGAAPLRLRQANPAGLTDREVEVLRLLAGAEPSAGRTTCRQCDQLQGASEIRLNHALARAWRLALG
jgi:hypothetical protein